MIDLIYRIVQTLVNKENNGYITPQEFDLMAKTAQEAIYNNYFSDMATAKNRKNRGFSNKGFADTSKLLNEKLSRFAKKVEITGISGVFVLPTDLYFIQDDGVEAIDTIGGVDIDGPIIEFAESHELSRLKKSSSPPTITFPKYEQLEGSIEVAPNSINKVRINYIRKPKDPRWTYRVILGKEILDTSNNQYQDFELHQSEFYNITLRILSMCGISIRENAVVEVAEALKDKQKIENNE